MKKETYTKYQLECKIRELKSLHETEIKQLENDNNHLKGAVTNLSERLDAVTKERDAKEESNKKKEESNKSGTRQLVDTGWKEFDRQTNCITTGNAVCNTQISSFIRPYSDTKCNGFTFKPGELLEADLKPFKKYDIPDRILGRLDGTDREDDLILYMFFTMKRGSTKVDPFLWVVTTPGPACLKLVEYAVVHEFGTSLVKRWDAKNEILKYITGDKNG